MTARISVEVLEVDRAAQQLEAWRALCERCLEPSVFNDPDFVLAAARNLRAPRASRVFAAWRRGDMASDLVGLCIAAPSMPFSLTARAWNHAQATAAYPLLDREYASEALGAILAAVGRMPGRAALLLSGLPCQGPTVALLGTAKEGARELDTRTRAVLRSGSSGSALPGKARKELRRQLNRLGDRGRVSFTSASDPKAVSAALDQFFALEAGGWKGRRGTALGNRPGTRDFARTALLGLTERGQCRIESLDLDGVAAAMGIVLRSGDRAFFWKTAYDEGLSRFSPGLQLAQHLTASQLRDPGVSLTDSCAVPGHSMIDRLWPDRMSVADYLVPTGKAGSPGFAWAFGVESRRRRLRSTAKAMLQTLAARRAKSVPAPDRPTGGLGEIRDDPE